MMTRAAVFAVAALVAAAPARAQVLEDVLVKREGTNAVIEVRFAGKVQYLRSALNARKTSLQVFFRAIDREADGTRTVEEFRKPPTQDLVPPFTVTFPIQPAAPQQRLDIAFEKPVDAKVRAGADNRSVRIEVPLSKEALAKAPPPARPVAPKAPEAAAPKGPPPPAAAAPSTAPAPSASATASAGDAAGPGLVAEAKAALDAGRLDDAIQKLNAALNLPPHAGSREAQELIGVVRERRGDKARARVEYELFLKLYPSGADAERVKKRLAGLGEAPKVAEAPRAATRTGSKASAWGSVSQYYFGGQLRSDSQFRVVTPATDATTIDTLSISGTDQSSLVTNIDANARYSTDLWDHRLVFRDTNSHSFLKEVPSYNRVTSLYEETRYDPVKAMVRIGRQSSTLGGILGRFDGGIAGLEVMPRVRLSVVGGRPVDIFDGTLKPVFYGVAADFEGFERWGGTVYAIQQKLEGVLDRRSLGAEARYFDTRRSLVAFLDYDASFRAVNIGMLQGNWQLESGTSFNLLADYRRTPSLQLSNALLAGRGLTFQQYLETFGESQSRRDARDATPVSKLLFVGVTQPLSPKWQVGADLRLSSLSGTPEIGLQPASSGTGTVYTYSLNLIGSGLMGNGDVTLINASYLTGAINKALAAGITERFVLGERWTLEPSLRFYRQKDEADVQVSRVSTGLKVSYKLRESLLLDAEVNWERTKTTSEDVTDTTTRRFYYMGYRWAF